MRRKGHIGSLSNLRRSEPKGRAKECSECDQNERVGPEGPPLQEAEESRAVSLSKACKEERTDATGTEQKALNAPGPEGRKRLCLICSKPSDETICSACADQVSADALEKKRWEETGKP
jgi:hypothetical protein